MLTVETIGKIRLKHRQGKSIRSISRELRLSRNTVRKVLRGDETEFSYQRGHQPYPKLGEYIKDLESFLAEDQKLPQKRRRSAQVLFEDLVVRGYEGGYDSVRRYVGRWRDEHKRLAAPVFIPLSFGPGQAFQFDWSEDQAELDGVTVKVNLAQIRLCHSRLFLVQAYPRQSQEMVFDAHRRGFAFFGGVCSQGIYDNPKTMVSKIKRGKKRVFHPRFIQLCSHYLYEPVFCTPGAAWEKGQVENQVGLVRRRFFTPRPKAKDITELNRWLRDQCVAWAMGRRHPSIPGKTVWEVFEQEREQLIKVGRPFDGYSEENARVSSYSLVSFDRNRYSVECTQAGKTVQIKAYADHLVIVSQGQVVGCHQRHFGRDKMIFDPWHYLPVLERKPGALRNGAPFMDWELPRPLERVKSYLKRFSDWDRQFVSILAAVPSHGLEAVSAACREALAQKAVSQEIILNILHRSQDQADHPRLELPRHLILKHEPLADCGRYDRLRLEASHDA